MRKYFGTDGVRGRANIEPLTADFALKLGRAAAGLFKNNDTHRKIIIGKDTRLSCYMFENALVSGICSAGIDAVMVGVIPTPAIAFLTKSIRADAGVVISASHNPYYDNGIKFFNANGYKLADITEHEIERMIDNNEPALDPYSIGKAYRIEGIGRYVEFVKNTFPKNIDLKGLKIVVDCANGASYKAAPLALRELGAELILTNVEPNGTNINDNCGAVYPENMAKAVLEHGADVGISFDGDADRVVFSDEKGNIVDGDKIMGICAIDMMEQGTLKNNTIVATVMSNLGFEYSMNKKGIKLIRSQVGDRYVMEDMLKYNCNLGGEQSGHLIFSDFNTTGDGLISAMQVLGLLIKKGKSLSELCSFIETYPQVLNNVLVDKKVSLDELSNTSALILKIEKELGTSGRLLVRYSGTENKLRIMLEGKDEKIITAYAEEIAEMAVNEIQGKKVMIKLGVNIDHVATLRQARMNIEPEPVTAARIAEKAGADGITIHLREDRRHIQDKDVYDIKKAVSIPLNLEMACSDDIINIAIDVHPNTCTIVPEKRQEITTEGGLDAAGQYHLVADTVAKLQEKGIKVSLFIEPDKMQIEAAKKIGAEYIEIHTGLYANTESEAQKRELNRIKEAAVYAHSLGLIVNAGHGLNYTNTQSIAAVPYMHEFNIGHSIISRAVFTGLEEAVKEMIKIVKK